MGNYLVGPPFPPSLDDERDLVKDWTRVGDGCIACRDPKYDLSQTKKHYENGKIKISHVDMMPFLDYKPNVLEHDMIEKEQRYDCPWHLLFNPRC